MRRFLVIISLIIFTTDSAFAACDPGYYEGTTTVTLPTTGPDSYGYISNDGSEFHASEFGLDGPGIWAAGWDSPYGMVVGLASCNSTAGSRSSNYMSNSDGDFTPFSTGEHCWCQLLYYDTYAQERDIVAKWVYLGEGDSSSSCKKYCAADCIELTFREGSLTYLTYRWYPLAASSVQEFRTWLQNSIISVSGSGGCVACPAKPDGAVWTTGCDFTCSAGTYQSSVTSSVTFPTTAPDSTTNSGTEWSATWSGDTASGTSGCSSSSSRYTSSGRYCWCKLTSWNSTSLTASWIYAARLSSSTCSSSCASSCASKMNSDSTFRSNSFNSVTNTPTVTITSTECIACPSGGTSSAGSTAITQCYIPTTTNFTDAAGTYHFSSNCYYSE